jgi:hypothetical protein
MVRERHLSYSTMNQAASAARFLYEKVLGRERARFDIPMAKTPDKQPELLARESPAFCGVGTHALHATDHHATGLRVSRLAPC